MPKGKNFSPRENPTEMILKYRKFIERILKGKKKISSHENPNEMILKYRKFIEIIPKGKKLTSESIPVKFHFPKVNNLNR
jgi:hypothetical protein